MSRYCSVRRYACLCTLLLAAPVFAHLSPTVPNSKCEGEFKDLQHLQVQISANMQNIGFSAQYVSGTLTINSRYVGPHFGHFVKAAKVYRSQSSEKKVIVIAVSEETIEQMVSEIPRQSRRWQAPETNFVAESNGDADKFYARVSNLLNRKDFVDDDRDEMGVRHPIVIYTEEGALSHVESNLADSEAVLEASWK